MMKELDYYFKIKIRKYFHLYFQRNNIQISSTGLLSNHHFIKYQKRAQDYQKEILKHHRKQQMKEKKNWERARFHINRASLDIVEERHANCSVHIDKKLDLICRQCKQQICDRCERKSQHQGLKSVFSCGQHSYKPSKRLLIYVVSCNTGLILQI